MSALFPDTGRLIFNTNPLVQVICQLRFPTILEIGSSEPAGFQKRIRQTYPLYQKQNQTNMVPKEIADVVQRLGINVLPVSVVHQFSTSDENRFITLASESLAMAERTYQRWEPMRAEMELTLKAMLEEYQPPFYSRIGLRYVDEIDKAKLGIGAVSWKELINPAIVGVLAHEPVAKAVQEMRCDLLLSISDDVADGLMRIHHGPARTENGTREVYRIDTDLYVEKRRAHGDVLGILDKFNRVAGNFFRWAITPKLAEAMGPKPLA